MVHMVVVYHTSSKVDGEANMQEGMSTFGSLPLAHRRRHFWVQIWTRPARVTRIGSVGRRSPAIPTGLRRCELYDHS